MIKWALIFFKPKNKRNFASETLSKVKLKLLKDYKDSRKKEIEDMILECEKILELVPSTLSDIIDSLKTGTRYIDNIYIFHAHCRDLKFHMGGVASELACLNKEILQGGKDGIS